MPAPKYSDLITVAIPVFERTKYYKEALSSALDQTIQCCVIVVDNASSHNDICDYVTALNNPLVRYIRNEHNLGMEGNWNACMQYAETEWLTILHDDDILYPKYVEIIVQYILHNNAACVAVKCDGGNRPSTIPGDSHSNIEVVDIKWWHYLWENLSPFPGVAFLREVGLSLGGFNAAWHPSADLEFWSRLSEKFRTVRIDANLAF
ncbi:MAG TPA: glycosyltransferase family 2 protein, partial [Parasulfuritortus sp.]